MNPLETTYLGLKLPTPIVAASSGLTGQPEKIRIMEEQGAGAVVLKSLFEEQILYEAGKLAASHDYPEAGDYIRYYTKNNSIDQYLGLIEKVKKEVNIPVIASVNCVSAGEWTGFARRMEEAGADAIEVNMYFLPLDPEVRCHTWEETYFSLAEKIRESISVPVAFKLGQGFTNLVYLVDQLYKRKVNGVVLFNRFYEPDIDPEKMHFTAASVFSTPSDISHSLRWVGIVTSMVEKMDVAASTGIHDGMAVVKQLLAGARVAQVCSVLYQKGPRYLGVMKRQVEQWMKDHSYRSLDEFRGKMNYKNLPDPAVYERSQFMKHFSGHH
ncbi:MAG: dihydroorotate dehydrogenase-like protein [Bacteroidales bacterium]